MTLVIWGGCGQGVQSILDVIHRTKHNGVLGTEAMTPDATVILLGAGFSACVSKGETPLMGGFFDRLDQVRYPFLHNFICQTNVPIDSANVEDCIALLDQLDDCPLTDLSGLSRTRESADEVRRELGEYCLHRLCCAKWDASHWATCVLAMADSNTTVITTNYDNLAESILSNKIDATHWNAEATCHHCRMRRILLADCECNEVPIGARPPWRGSVLKLHGSVAWKTCWNRSCNQFDCLIADQHCRPFDGRPCDCCGQPCQPVIVLPSARKRYSRYAHLRRMWDSAQSALKDAETLLIFGFSFPSSDCLIRAMFANAVCSGSLRHIAIIDLQPEAVAERIKSALPPEGLPAMQCFAVPTDGSRPEWLVEESKAEPMSS
jgi:NAD-dependent SIR2 family protein deacetylase